jgi:hypothetical protein
MFGFLVGWWRARAARPLLWWVVALLVYVVLPLPEHFVLFLIVGLGVALTVTVRRLREGGRDSAERVLGIAERLSEAIEDRIRYSTYQAAQVQPGYAEAIGPRIAPIPVPAVYDPGVLLSAVVAVLAAEGIPANAAAALPACAQLLGWQGIALAPACRAGVDRQWREPRPPATQATGTRGDPDGSVSTGVDGAHP